MQGAEVSPPTALPLHPDPATFVKGSPVLPPMLFLVGVFALIDEPTKILSSQHSLCYGPFSEYECWGYSLRKMHVTYALVLHVPSGAGGVQTCASLELEGPQVENPCPGPKPLIGT